MNNLNEVSHGFKYALVVFSLKFNIVEFSAKLLGFKTKYVMKTAEDISNKLLYYRCCIRLN